MIEIGQINELIVEGKDKKGYILKDALTDDEAFLPFENCSEDLKIQQRVNVFVYLDNDSNLIASLKSANRGCWRIWCHERR